MKLFQYWDSGSPPDEVAGWIEEFRVLNPHMKHQLYDRDRASWFIGKHLGHRERRAFDACAIPSMQSDVFRLCAVRAFGGVYVDVDHRCLQPLSDLVARAPHGLMVAWGPEIWHGLIYMRRPDDLLIEACLRLCVLNIEAADFDNAFMATGPGVVTAIKAIVKPETASVLFAKYDNMLQADWGFPRLVERAQRHIEVSEALVRAFDSLTLISKGDLFTYIGRTDAAYKQTGRHWLNWKGPVYADRRS